MKHFFSGLLHSLYQDIRCLVLPIHIIEKEVIEHARQSTADAAH